MDCDNEFRAMVGCFQENDEFYKKLEAEQRLKREARDLEQLLETSVDENGVPKQSL